MDTTNDTNPEPPTDAPSRPRRTQLRALLGLAVAVPAIGIVSFGVANASEEDDPAAGETSEEIVVTCGEEWTPTPEEITEFNAETDELAAFLAEQGIPHTVETTDDGLREVVIYDYEDDAANTAVDEFYAERYPMPAEDAAALNADEDALAAFLDERGIAYTREAGPDGISYVAVDENDEAAYTAVDEFWAERYPPSADAVAVDCVEVDSGDVDGEAAAIEAEMTAELSG